MQSRSLSFSWHLRLPALLGKGFMADNVTGEITLVKYHYLHNLLSSPVTLILLPAGWCWCLSSLWLGILRNSRRAIWYAGPATVAGGDGTLLHGRLRRHGILPFFGRPAEFPDTGQGLIEHVYAEDDVVCLIHYSLCGGLYLVCLEINEQEE